LNYTRFILIIMLIFADLATDKSVAWKRMGGQVWKLRWQIHASGVMTTITTKT